eukprot:GGOE01047971.1.p1 GENE.GGOE01047971.1~~GGOE01047971.1.p1  ORF type:complete len:832 (-),score=297.86 GGOE01047971.1:526-3021(-)
MRVSFALVLTVLTLILTLLPAILIWVVFSELMTSSLDLLEDTTTSSTHQLAETVQEMLLYESMQVLSMRLTEGENVLSAMLSFFDSSGLRKQDLRPEYLNIKSTLSAYQDRNFIIMKGHDYFDNIAMNAGYFPGNVDTGIRLFWNVWQAMNIDINTSQFQRTLYYSTLECFPGETLSQLNKSYANQLTGKPADTPMQSQIVASTAYTISKSVISGWDKDLGFNQFSGQVNIGLWAWVAAQNNTWLQASISLNAQTMSQELASQLGGNTTQDRLFIFFRQPHGHLLAASHGKFYSQSDVDRRYVNPLTNPINMSAYYRYTCIDSNDERIHQSCVQLYAMYQNNWTAIPALQTEMLLGGNRYWVAAGLSNTSLDCTVVMLKNREAVMGSIDASQEHVNNEVNDKKVITFVILGVITAIGVIIPLSIGVWLGSRLIKLAAGMDQIAKLDFNVSSTPPTLFSELHRFQTSFVQMERGLRAFGKFVPQAVVRVLIAGKMEANGQMTNETLTIMFADIEGFSTICESIPPEQLALVCTEYFESMCANIVNRKGTIDKFIGDCIMAMWNAPQQLPGHERDAVESSLAMQNAVIQLHQQWRQRGLPLLKFRLGIHTGHCLVGNFGCSYRVSYTCLGDSVNLSARLEALNKKFGTYICISQSTYEGCKEHFYFRRLAKVTVPGKTEVLPVYEVLCRIEAGEVSNSSLLIQPDVPGAAQPREEEMTLSPYSRMRKQNPSSDCMKVMDAFEGDAKAKAKPCRNGVPWHWYFVDREQLLSHADVYESAYDAMVTGNVAKARDILKGKQPLDLPDKAWKALVDQLDQLGTSSQPWDGVFYFKEK